MKVVVFGASGFIGHGIAQAFCRAGHIVYGQTRSHAKAVEFQKEEIVPLVCDPSTPEGVAVFTPIVEQADIVIDTIPAYTPEAPLSLFNYISSLPRGHESQRLTYFYTGGSWVHSRGLGGLEKWTSETQPYSGRVELTAWRWEVEKVVLSSDKVNGIVIRPSALYGKDGTLFIDAIFKPALEAAKRGEAFETFGKEDARFLLVHPDDLGELFVRGSVCKGQAFVACNPQSERLTDILDAVVRVSGAKGYTLREPSTLYEKAWGDSTTQLKPVLGEALTGWRPRKMGLVDGMEIYWNSFVASQSGGN